MQKAASALGIIAAIYALFLLPYLFSEGFITLVFKASEQFKIFDTSIQFSSGLFFYVLIAAYVYVLFKAFSFRRMTKNILFMIIGVIFTLFVTFLVPAQGWYIWCIPFIVYFFIRQKTHSTLLYWGINGFYILYFILIPESDIFAVFRLLNAKIATLSVPYTLIQSASIDSAIILSVAFTFLSANLIYIAYLMYTYGVKSSLLFQQQDGIPLIGISGDSGSGKTTISSLIRMMFGEQNVTTVLGDDVHKWERGDTHWKKYTHLNLLSNRIHYHYDQVAQLKKGKMIKRAHYDHATGRFTTPLMIQPKEYIIDEGLHTFTIDNKSVHNLKVFMDPSNNLRVFWKVTRDMQKRGYSEEQVLKELRKRETDAEKYVSPQKKNADMIISLQLEEEIRDSIKKHKKVECYLELFIRSEIPVEPVLDAISSVKNIEVQLDYPDNIFQKITFKGRIDNDQIIGILKKLDIDYSEYGIRLNKIQNNNSGLMQLFILYCLHQRLLQKSGGKHE